MPQMPKQKLSSYADRMLVNTPQYKELLNYLTARNVQPQGRLMNSERVDTVDELMQEMTAVARMQMNMQEEENKSGKFAQEAAKMRSRQTPDAATEFRILLDLATRDLQNQPAKPRPML